MIHTHSLRIPICELAYVCKSAWRKPTTGLYRVFRC